MKRPLLAPTPPPTRFVKDFFGILVSNRKEDEKALRRWHRVNYVIRLINEDRSVWG